MQLYGSWKHNALQTSQAARRKWFNFTT